MRMKFGLGFVLAVGVVGAMTACAPPSSEVADSQTPLTDWVQIQGAAMYRERIALPPGATLEILVEDTAIADRAAPVIERRTIPISATPAPFTIRIPRRLAGEGNHLNLRLSIRDSGGLRWITDSHIAISADPFSNYIDVGEHVLVSAR